MNLIGVIESAGIPALRVAATIAVLFMAGVGLFIYRNRHRFFDRDPDVDNDFPVVRHIRAEEVVLVWSGLTLLMVSILVQVWLA
jgi:amino acid transporter